MFASRKGTLGEVPWVMGDPSSTYNWQVTAAGKGKRGKGSREKSDDLEDIVLYITLDVKKKEVEGGFLRGRRLEEKIRVLEVAGAVLRGLHKAKYTEINAVTGDGKTLHYAKVDAKSFKEILRGLEERDAAYDRVKIKAAHGAKRTVFVEINRKHEPKKAPITVAFGGKVSSGSLNTLVGYLQKHLPVKEVKME